MECAGRRVSYIDGSVSNFLGTNAVFGRKSPEDNSFLMILRINMKYVAKTRGTDAIR